MIEATFPHHLVQSAITAALREDLGLAGDITGNAVLSATETMSGTITARQSGIIAGLPLVIKAFHALDPTIKVTQKMRDGDKVKAGDIVVTIKGNSRAILASERVALNYLCHLSGIASLTEKFVKEIKERVPLSVALARPCPDCAPFKNMRCVQVVARTIAMAWIRRCS